MASEMVAETQPHQPHLSPVKTLDENPLLSTKLVDQDQPISSSSPSVLPHSCDPKDSEAESTAMFSSFSLVPRVKPTMVGAGLVNLGNTCFLNSILQCFTHTVPFVENLRSWKHSTSSCGGKEGFCIICVLREHIETALGSSGRTICPYRLVDNLSHISAYFQRHQQEDAHEFLQCLLDRLDTCCLDGSIKDQSSSSEENSFVKKIFGGRLRSQLRCSNCGHCSDTFEPLIDLSLEIEDVETLSSALESFTRVEKIEETKFTCENCKEEALVEKQFTLDKTPSIAAFHLKRFKNNGSYVEKIDKYVEYPLELDLHPYTSNGESNDVDSKYELYGVVVHVGASSWSGHYFCFIRSSPQTWYQLDDSMVSRVNEEYVLSQEAYILFYAKQGTPWFSTLMKTQKQLLDTFGANTSPKSVLDDVHTVSTTYPVCASTCKGNATISREDERRISTSLPIKSCSIDVIKYTNDSRMVKDRGVEDVMKDVDDVNDMKARSEVDVVTHTSNVPAMTNRSAADILKDINDVHVCPRTPPERSPSPDLYADEPPEVSYSIPRDHLRLRSQTSSSKKVNKTLEDSKKNEAIRLTRSMPSSRAAKLQAYIQGPKTESINKKKRKMEFSSPGRKANASGACRKLNPSILHSVTNIDFST